jgi:hypothetical protein
MSTTFLLPALLLAALAATARSLTVRPECQSSCGGVDIPYPFGIGTGCFREGFEIICNSSMSMPVLGNRIQIQVLNLTVTPRPEAEVMLPVAYQCYDSSNFITVTNIGDVDFNKLSVYRISNTRNELFVLGCNSFVYTSSGPRGRYAHNKYAGCVAFANDSRSAQDGACAGVGCCSTDIPPGLTDNSMHFNNDNLWSHANQEFCPCDYAFIVEKGNYTFRAADLNSSMTLVGSRRPLLLDWAIRDESTGDSSLSCANAASMPEHAYTCVSDNSECFNSTNGPGYICNCTKGYEGNPYLHKGCTSKLLCLLVAAFNLKAIASLQPLTYTSQLMENQKPFLDHFTYFF